MSRLARDSFAAFVLAASAAVVVSACSSASPAGAEHTGPTPGSAAKPSATTTTYPWHTKIVSTTFWVGEIFDPNASDGSQVVSTYDSNWLDDYGGCDGVVAHNSCETEKRTSANGFFPLHMTPLENPFYLDLPFDDINDAAAFARRGSVIPWAHEAPYVNEITNPNVSLMKNYWVEIKKSKHVCYGQIEDAGPGQYNNAAYVFSKHNTRPSNKKYNHAGMDVSPALNGCLNYSELNGEDDKVSWRFVRPSDVPTGPWTTLITTSPARE